MFTWPESLETGQSISSLDNKSIKICIQYLKDQLSGYTIIASFLLLIFSVWFPSFAPFCNLISKQSPLKTQTKTKPSYKSSKSLISRSTYFSCFLPSSYSPFRFLFHMVNSSTQIWQKSKNPENLHRWLRNWSMMQTILMYKIISMGTFWCTYFCIFFLK